MLNHPGRYGSPPSWRIWLVQLLSWSSILFVMKIIVSILIYIFRAPLGLMGYLLFFPFHHHPKVELLIVMIFCPLVMNMVQFWIQDSFLMDHADKKESLPLLSARSRGSGPKMQKRNSLTNASNAAEMYEDL